MDSPTQSQSLNKQQHLGVVPGGKGNASSQVLQYNIPSYSPHHSYSDLVIYFSFGTLMCSILKHYYSNFSQK
jgi:hypothetical protein